MIPKGVHVQQITTTTLPINIFVANGLLVHGNDVLFQYPIRVNLHPQLSGESLEGSFNGGMPRKGGSPNQDPLRRLLLDPHVGF